MTVPADNDGSKIWDWLQFLRAKQKGEFEMIAAANPEVREAVDILYEISADEKVRAEYDARQKAWMDRQSQFDGYYKQGKAEGKAEGMAQVARKMKAAGRPLNEIVEFTGLPVETVKKM